MLTTEIAVFASRHNIAAEVAHVLPALFEFAAGKIGMTPRQLVATATYHNQEAADYIKQVAEQVAAKPAE